MASINISKWFNKVRGYRLRIPLQVGQTYRFDARTGRLAIGQQEVILRPKTAALFEVLSSRPDKIHSKQQLLDIVWRDIHVQDQAVFQCVNEIRQAFGLKACIRTVPGKGYQWTGLQKGPTKNSALYSRAFHGFSVTAFAALLFSALHSAQIQSATEDQTSINILPIASSSTAPRDHGLAASFEEMLKNHKHRIEVDRLQPTAATSGLPDIVIRVALSREGEQLQAAFSINGQAGSIEGIVRSSSQAWLAQQIAYEIEDAAGYTFVDGRGLHQRIARHQELIRSKEHLYADRLKGAVALARMAAADPTFQSAQYFSLLTETESGLAISRNAASALVRNSRNDGDELNEARGYFLLALHAQSSGDTPAAKVYLEDGREIAENNGYDSLAAAFDFRLGVTLAAERSYGLAERSFDRALAGYREVDCLMNVGLTFEQLVLVYQSTGARNKEVAAKRRLEAIDTILSS